MHTHAQIVAALRRVPDKTDFSRRHDIAHRTIYNLLTPPSPTHQPTRTTLRAVGAALEADGLLKVRKTRKKAAA